MSEGAPIAIRFAAAYPQRAHSLVLYGGYAHFHKWVTSPSRLRVFIDTAEAGWGRGATLPHFAPGRVDDQRFSNWWALRTAVGKSELAIAALEQAIAVRRPPPGSVIHHSDGGVQYACAEYAARLAAHRIQPSMSRIGNPYDNAKAERFMRTLKEEEVDGRAYRDIIDAKKSIGEFIERVYNRQRLHSALDYLSPDEYEAGLTRLRQDPPAAIQNLENCP
ncbi:integrase core domain-containing protein [Mesorhizobium sp.]|uniref:integrase core domain-containing protein n=1 Tax=Mesorhizobium sp. TaxID=1871066 RepID=UPI00121FD0F4|nr:integrase core domain-containing protein [Mesorhizobium sp.]TIS55560.1 MAG: hypothetical protein E5W91_22000 [Mesorhizobium sp.]TIS87856.1 MAG: hypothetical protein E5W89_23035 [Mesorhizobium sp.]